MTHYEELSAATARDRERLLAIPFIRDGGAGRLRLRDYVAFLTQAYHHVKHTLPLLMACGARLPSSTTSTTGATGMPRMATVMAMADTASTPA